MFITLTMKCAFLLDFSASLSRHVCFYKVSPFTPTKNAKVPSDNGLVVPFVGPKGVRGR